MSFFSSVDLYLRIGTLDSENAALTKRVTALETHMSKVDDELTAVSTELGQVKTEQVSEKLAIVNLQAALAALQANPPSLTPAQQALLDTIKTNADAIAAGQTDIISTLGPQPGPTPAP
jgi:hypothetical protein